MAAAAQQAVEANMRHRPDADGEKINKSTTLKDVVGGATEVLPANKVTPGRTPTRWRPPRRRTMRAD